MALTAEYSQITWDEFFQPTFAVYPDLEEQFKAEFITYKSTGAPSNMLGRDAPFTFHRSRLMRTFSLPTSTCTFGWPGMPSRKL